MNASGGAGGGERLGGNGCSPLTWAQLLRVKRSAPGLGWVSRRPGKSPSSTAPTETPAAGEASPPTPAATLPSTATISPPAPQGYSESREEGLFALHPTPGKRATALPHKTPPELDPRPPASPILAPSCSSPGPPAEHMAKLQDAGRWVWGWLI